MLRGLITNENLIINVTSFNNKKKPKGVEHVLMFLTIYPRSSLKGERNKLELSTKNFYVY